MRARPEGFISSASSPGTKTLPSKRVPSEMGGWRSGSTQVGVVLAVAAPVSRLGVFVVSSPSSDMPGGVKYLLAVDLPLAGTLFLSAWLFAAAVVATGVGRAVRIADTRAIPPRTEGDPSAGGMPPP